MYQLRYAVIWGREKLMVNSTKLSRSLLIPTGMDSFLVMSMIMPIMIQHLSLMSTVSNLPKLFVGRRRPKTKQLTSLMKS